VYDHPRFPALAAFVSTVVIAATMVGGCRQQPGSSPPSMTSTRAMTETTDTYDPYAGTVPAVDAIGATSEGTLTTPDGRTRHFRMYVPAGLAANMMVPLVIALHGGLGSSAQFEAQSGFDGLAESNRFIVVYPDGVTPRPAIDGLQTWNGGSCCGPAMNQNVDDVTFISLLIDRIIVEQPVDPARIFATGHSNGAILAYRLACELADRISAIGVQAGVLGVDPCNPVRPVSVFHIHGTADTNIPIDGGKGSGPSNTDFGPPRDAVGAFALADRCSSGPTISTDANNPDVVATTWNGCTSDVEVRFVTVDGASHAWMGHDRTSAALTTLTDAPYTGFDSSRAIWSFLAERQSR
jgi:polyhydroxybutyrate depolymerase